MMPDFLPCSWINFGYKRRVGGTNIEHGTTFGGRSPATYRVTTGLGRTTATKCDNLRIGGIRVTCTQTRTFRLFGKTPLPFWEQEAASSNLAAPIT
jgi:hypothetical protein